MLSYKKKEHSINTSLFILVMSAKIRLVDDIRTWFIFMYLQSLSQHLTARFPKACWILQIAFSGMFSQNDNTDWWIFMMYTRKKKEWNKYNKIVILPYIFFYRNLLWVAFILSHILQQFKNQNNNKFPG